MIMVQQQQQTGGNTVASKEIDLTYDALGDLTSRVGYGFIGIGPRTDVTTGTFSYNTLGQLTSLKYTADGGANTIDTFGWTYDPLGRTATFTSSDGTATYGYDNTSQLVSATYTGTNQPANENFTLDANGNRAATGTVVSANNQVTNDGTFTYTFDHEGNRLTRTRISDAQANDYLTTYTWDYRNRLTDVDFYNNSSTLTQHLHYTYDVFNNLISRSVDATGPGSYSEIDYFAYDIGAPNTAADRAVLEFIDPDGSGPDPAALAERYLIGPDVAGLIDQVYAQENVSTGATTWLLSDNLGSTRDTVDAGGMLTGHFNYNSFGQLMSGPTNITPFLFTGEFTDPATHLEFNAARWLDPDTGTWLSPDPADFGPGDANLTRYVLNQPTTFIDPSGLQAMRDASGAPLVYPQAAASSPAATAATDAVFGAFGQQVVDEVDPPIIVDNGGGGGGGGDDLPGERGRGGQGGMGGGEHQNGNVVGQASLLGVFGSGKPFGGLWGKIFRRGATRVPPVDMVPPQQPPSGQPAPPQPNPTQRRPAQRPPQARAGAPSSEKEKGEFQLEIEPTDPKTGSTGYRAGYLGPLRPGRIFRRRRIGIGTSGEIGADCRPDKNRSTFGGEIRY